MIDEKLAIITINDVNPSHSEDILTVTERLNKLKIKYNLGTVPCNLKNHHTFSDEISSLMKSGNIERDCNECY
jgi:hypothetical protein